MNAADVVYLGIFFLLLVASTPLLGRWLARTFQGNPPRWLAWLGPVEKTLYRAAGVRPDEDMTWRGYACALVAFNLLGALAVLALQLLQAHLPLNPQNFPAVPLGVAVNTAVSFMTNTNWQAYSGEATMSYGVQMVGLSVQNFLSAATGLAVLAALARGFSRRSAQGIGNFWADLVRTTVYVLLPLSFATAIVLLAQGVVM
jgi:K+-transporting ATPase ATPase A chain